MTAGSATCTAHQPVAPDFARQAREGHQPADHGRTGGGTLSFGLANARPDEPRLAGEHVGRRLDRRRRPSAPVVAGGAAAVSAPVGPTVPTVRRRCITAAPSGTTVQLPITVAAPARSWRPTGGVVARSTAAIRVVAACRSTNPAKRLLDTRVSPTQRAEFDPGQHVAHRRARQVRHRRRRIGRGAQPDLGQRHRGRLDPGVPVRHAADRLSRPTSTRAPTASWPTSPSSPLDSTGAVCFQTYATSDLVVDLQGWYPAGHDYHAMRADAHRRHPHRPGHRHPPVAVPDRRAAGHRGQRRWRRRRARWR